MSQFFSSNTLPARTTAPTPDPPPFGSRVDDYLDNLGGSGGTGQFTDTILAGAGLTVHGAGFLSYPGEGLIKDGLSYVANAVHNKVFHYLASLRTPSLRCTLRDVAHAHIGSHRQHTSRHPQ